MSAIGVRIGVGMSIRSNVPVSWPLVMPTLSARSAMRAACPSTPDGRSSTPNSRSTPKLNCGGGAFANQFQRNSLTRYASAFTLNPPTRSSCTSVTNGLPCSGVTGVDASSNAGITIPSGVMRMSRISGSLRLSSAGICSPTSNRSSKSKRLFGKSHRNVGARMRPSRKSTPGNRMVVSESFARKSSSAASVGERRKVALASTDSR